MLLWVTLCFCFFDWQSNGTTFIPWHAFFILFRPLFSSFPRYHLISWSLRQDMCKIAKGEWIVVSTACSWKGSFTVTYRV